MQTLQIISLNSRGKEDASTEMQSRDKSRCQKKRDVEEDSDVSEQNEQEQDEPEQPPNAEKENNDEIIMDRVNIFERIDEFFGIEALYQS